MRRRNLFTLVGFLVFCGLILWANTQAEKKPLEPIPIGQPIPEKQPTSKKGALEPAPIGQLTGERLPKYQPSPLQPIATLQGQDGIAYQVREFKDFRGGWDLVSGKTKIAPNRASELENALWNPQGEMYKRPGYSEHSTPPFIPNFLYRYYQQDGDKWTIGGSDTALYFWHEDSSGDGWTYLIGTEETEGRWDGTTFEDMFVGTHEGITPVVWDGSTTVEMGTILDSFQIVLAGWDCDSSAACEACSSKLTCWETETGWDDGDWTGYIVTFPAQVVPTAGDTDTVTKNGYIIDSEDNSIWIRHAPLYAGRPLPLFTWPIEIGDHWLKIFSWFQIDTVWREGQIDSVTGWGADTVIARLWDSTYTWDSTFAYDDWIFEVISGKGEGKKTFLANYNEPQRDILDESSWTWWTEITGNDTATAAFLVPGFSDACFDSTTTYRIYKVSFWTGSKFVENFDGSLWLGWTGIGDEQEKNRVVWSELNDLGNWPPENEVWIESDDGDYITGMAKFPGEYTDVPRQEMIVTKNNSLYKIVPSGDAYNFWLIASGVGCVSNSAISPAEGLLLFPDQHGVWAYDKRKPVSISQRIDPIFEEWNLDALENVSAIYNPQDRHYHLSYPSTDGIYQGQFIVSYDVDTTGCNPCGIYTNIVDTDGSKLGEHNDMVGGNKYSDIAVRNNGDYIIVWHSQTGGSTGEIWLQRFDVLGDAEGDSIQLNGVDDSCSLYWPSADMNKDGDIVACWEDFRDGRNNGNIQDIYCQCVDWDDGLVGNNFVANATYVANALDAHYPDVAINDGGFFVVTWTDSLNHIYAQKYTGCGSADGSNFSVKFDDQNSYSSVAVGEDNQFVVTWQSTEGTGNKDIWMRFYDSGGTVGDSTLVNTADANRNHDQVDVAMNSNGKFVVVWQKDSTEATERNIYARKYTATGVASGAQFLVNDPDAEADVDLYPAVAINDNDDFLVAWQEAKNATDDIYGRIYTWSAAVDTAFPINDDIDAEQARYPAVAVVSGRIEAATHAIVWSFDHRGWSRETVVTSTYAYQHSLSDTVKIIFSDTDKPRVYNYATQADDVDDPVILTYQTPYVGFGQYPSFDYEMRFATIEAFLDTGNIYLTWYKNYNDSTYSDSLVCGSDCREEMKLPEDLWGKNISMKLKTGSNIDDFTLSRFWWEWTVNQKFRK